MYKWMGIHIEDMQNQVREKLCLDGIWRCKIDNDNCGIAEEWAKRSIDHEFEMEVPGCIQTNTALSDQFPPKSGLKNTYKGTYWLEKEFFIAKTQKQLARIQFGGIAPAAHIWINGIYIGYSGLPMVAGAFDITESINYGQKNRITVAIIEQELGLLGGFRGFGFEWSGLYRTVEILFHQPIYIENIRSRQYNDKCLIDATIANDTTEACTVASQLQIRQEEETLKLVQGEQITVPPGESLDITLEIDVSDLKKWSCDHPNLYQVSLNILKGKGVIDSQTRTIGFRTLKAEGDKIYLNGEPYMLRGVGQEYFSPTISPLTDRELIRQRYRAMKEFGFNFCRCHTYVPTAEEVSVADEIGVILSVEVSLVSNFHKVTPFDKGLFMLEKYIIQTSCNPSVGIYCIGNEGSQLMVADVEEREKATKAYNKIKQTAPECIAMAAFGSQNELPEVPNDIESPHLWSHNFLWAYEGLSKIPYYLLGQTCRQKPNIIHEFGKFGVFPNPQEENIYPSNGYIADFGWQSREALEEIGLLELEEKFIKNSRKLHYICTRILIESARRQAYVNGYVMWTFFRCMDRNAGFIDDMAQNPDVPPSLYRNGCNAPVALLIDRDFDGRTFYGGTNVEIGLYISNYGGNRNEQYGVKWNLSLMEGEITGETVPVELENGVNKFLGNIVLQLPNIRKPQKVTLTAQLTDETAVNAWDFWVFPHRERINSYKTVCSFKDKQLESSLIRKYNGMTHAKDWDSIIRGCRSWSGTDYEHSFEAITPEVYISDTYDDLAKTCIKKGIKTVLIDSGNFPKEWYCPPFYADGEDTSNSFTSFRAGWDQGKLATVIGEGSLWDFPHEGFCHLQFYSMLQGANGLSLEDIRQSIGLDCQVKIRAVAKVRAENRSRHIVQDINAIKVQEQKKVRNITMRDQVYLVETEDSLVTVCSLKMACDPAGEYLLERLIV